MPLARGCFGPPGRANVVTQQDKFDSKTLRRFGRLNVAITLGTCPDNNLGKRIEMFHRALASVVLVAAVGGAVTRAQETARQDLFLDVEGIKVHYTVEGAGEPVVLLHGFLASIDWNWRLPGITTALAEKFRVVAIDHRGHGKSSRPQDPELYGIEMVNDVARVMNDQQIAKAHIIGYSMGGFIAMKLMEQHPDRFLSATLGGSGGIREDYPNWWKDRMIERLETADSLEEALRSVSPGNIEAGDRRLEMLKPLMRGQDNKALAAVLRSWNEFSVPYTVLENNEIPTLFVYGKEDSLRPYIEPLKGRMKNAQFEPIDGANHMTAVVNPVFRQKLIEFVEANSGN